MARRAVLGSARLSRASLCVLLSTGRDRFRHVRAAQEEGHVARLRNFHAGKKQRRLPGIHRMNQLGADENNEFRFRALRTVWPNPRRRWECRRQTARDPSSHLLHSSNKPAIASHCPARKSTVVSALRLFSAGDAVDGERLVDCATEGVDREPDAVFVDDGRREGQFGVPKRWNCGVDARNPANPNRGRHRKLAAGMKLAGCPLSVTRFGSARIFV